GPIPEGWRIGRLSEPAEILMGTSPPSETYNDTALGVPLINGPVEFGERFPIKSKWTTASVRLTEPGDLIFCVRGSTTGRRVVSDGVYGLGRGVCAIRAKSSFQPYINLLIDVELPRLLSNVTGSVFPSLSAPDLKNFRILLPPSNVLQAFCESGQALIAKCNHAESENAKLADLRDYLLPKLLSGTIR